MRWQRPAGLYPIRGPMGVCHLLVDGKRAILIDTGLFFEGALVRRRLGQLGLPPESLEAILLTHGHLDHTANAAALQRWSGARLYVHPHDEHHVAGTHRYTGSSRWCGRLEALGRWLTRFSPPRVDAHLHDQQLLPFWDGLRVLHLPGHTAGHCGFYSERHQLLFCGDLFASYGPRSHLPPRFLNTDRRLLRQSLARVREFNPPFILPNHLDRYDGELHRRRLDRLAQPSPHPLV